MAVEAFQEEITAYRAREHRSTKLVGEMGFDKDGRWQFPRVEPVPRDPTRVVIRVRQREGTYDRGLVMTARGVGGVTLVTARGTDWNPFDDFWAGLKAYLTRLGLLADAGAGPGEPLPEGPERPSEATGWDWNDVFDWMYRINRKVSLKDLAGSLGYSYDYVRQEHSKYKAAYGANAKPDDKSKFKNNSQSVR